MIQAFKGNNAFLLNNSDGTDLPGGPVNGRMMKHYSPPQQRPEVTLSIVQTIFYFSCEFLSE
jgi:hypothetical protein